VRAAARFAAVIGALGSSALVGYAGRNNPHPVLVVLFVVWVSSPFVGYGLARRFSSAALDAVVILAAVASVVVFTIAVIRPGRAVPFVLVPGVSWVVLLVVVAASAIWGRRGSSDATRSL
jgi:hypothetical protein